MRQYFAYIRVSTTRQGEQGVSLPQQRDAIERYAQRNQLEICQWFEEQETAAKQGRPVFGAMVRQLRKRSASGVIIHKIDRSARNLRDWADLGELIDQGVEVHFANESLDLTSRGGRLSADIQAVVAADYIRNLREESKKGFYGRLKQGYYPMPAPTGYLNHGAAKAKTPDPATAPFVRRAFELYASGRFNLRNLGGELARAGFRRPNGKLYCKNRLSELLNNPFYCGLIHIKKTGEYFTGLHEPLISRKLFETVGAILAGKTNTVVKRRDFTYRRRLACKSCHYSLIGEVQKNHTYYRCHTANCPTTGIREEAVELAVLEKLSMLQLNDRERQYVRQQIDVVRGDVTAEREKIVAALKLKSAQNEDRLARVTDAFIDQLIERDLFEERKKALLTERLDLKSQIQQWQAGTRDPAEELGLFLERANGAFSAYRHGTLVEKRDLVDCMTSNRVIEGKTPIITLRSPFSIVAERAKTSDGCPRRDIHRTWKPLLSRLRHTLGLDRPTQGTE